MTTGSTSYMHKSFVEGLLRKSVPQRKVSARLRLNQARSQGGGNASPNSGSCTKNFQGNQGFDA